MKVSEKQALSVRCPTCGSRPGEKCELSTGLPRTDPHRDRRLAASDKSVSARSRRFSIAGCVISTFACLRSFTSIQDHEDTAQEEHCGYDCCEIQVGLYRQSASCMCLRRTELHLTELHLTDVLNLWPNRCHPETRVAPQRRPVVRLVGYGANAPKPSHTVRPENAWRQFPSPPGH